MNTEHLFNKYYFSDPDFIDGTTQFHQLCQANILPGSKILEVGPGPSNPTTDYLGSIGPVVGLDISPEAKLNKSLSECYIYNGRSVPFKDETFGACVSDYVLEHIHNPEEHLREIARILMPNGVYCVRTPNLLHYVALGSSLLPHSMHLKLSKRFRALGEQHPDPYPTFYRANTQRTLTTLAQSAGLYTSVLRMIEPEPTYGKRYSAMFYPMLGFERLVNHFGFLESFRANILAAFKKPHHHLPSAPHA